MAYNYKYRRDRNEKNKKEMIAYSLKKYYEMKEKIKNPKTAPIVNIKMERIVLDFS